MNRQDQRFCRLGHSLIEVIEVVQCINYPQGRFSDSAMQAYLEYLPM